MKKKLLVALGLLYGCASAHAQSITGTLSVCVGQNTALSHSTPDGTWSSGNTGVATVGSSGEVTGVAVGTANVSYVVGETTDVATVTVNALPNAITGPSLVCIGSNITLKSNLYGTWSSSNTDVATVEEVEDNNHAFGRVTGVAAGSVVITYTRTNGCYTTHTVEVPSVLETPITCDYEFYVCEGSDLALANATSGGTWVSSNDYIGSVGSSSGIVHGGHLDLGPAREIFISYVTTDEIKRCAVHSFTVNPLVRVVYVTEVCIGNSITFVPDSLGGTWSSSGPTILSINSSGVATGVSAGPAQIIYQLPNRPNCMNNRATSSPSIIVASPPAISGSLAVCIGQTSELSTGVGGTWSSSTPAIGTIGTSNGVLGGISAGNTTITFTKSIACYTTAEATVNGAPATITGTLSVCPGGTRTLSSATPGGTWASSNTAAATIGTSGIVTGVAAGTSVITYTAPTGCITTAIFTVNAAPVAAPSYEAIVCTTGTLRLFANDIGTNTYLWTGPSSYSSTAQNPTRASATTAMGGTYTLAVTSTTTGCSAAYTVAVTVLTSSPYTVSVTQIAPFTLYGDTRHTYGSGFTLRADPSLTLPGTGVTYTWSGPVAGSAYTFAPTFTPSTVITTKNYTVTVAYNGCSAFKRDTIVVPPTSCHPYNYFSVNNYRTSKGLAALGGCSDCNTVQPFHTITGNVLNASNVADGENYYVTAAVTCKKTQLKNNNFFMAYNTKVYIDSLSTDTIDHCHFYGPCGWTGIIVTPGVNTTAHLRIINNSLVENAVNADISVVASSGVIVWPTASGKGHYTPGMADILESDGVIYNRDGYGISLWDYKPSMSAIGAGDRLPFTIKNSVFCRVELAAHDAGTTSAANYPFSWPTTAQLKAVTSGTIPTYGLNAYRVSGPDCYGMYITNVGNKTMLTAGDANTPATYEYNYLHIGAGNVDPYYDSTNVFDSLGIAITVGNSNVKMFNNSFRNITNMAVSAGYTYNDLRIEGDTADHTNNRFYNCGTGIRLHGNTPDPWDFTCRNTVFKAAIGVSGMVPPRFGCYLALTNGHGSHTFNHNYIKNYDAGIWAANLGTASLKGNTRIYGNTIEGKTTYPSTDSVRIAIYVTDGVNSTYGNGDVTVDSNFITGAALGVHGESVARRLYVLNNKIAMLPYMNPQTGNVIAGIYMATCPGMKETKYNTVTGRGYNCIDPNSIFFSGYKFSNTGKSTNVSEISCNLAEDINHGFTFAGTSYVNWRRNQMNRNGTGIFFDPGGSFGQQGSLCNPTDNRWTNTGTEYNVCGGTFPGWLTTSVSATHTSNANPNLSKIYVRDSVGFKPFHNTNNGGYVAFAYGTTLLYAEDASCSPLADPIICGPSTGAKSSANDEDNTMATVTAGNMRIFPNPATDGVTVEITDALDGNMRVKVINAVGAEVYNNMHTFANGRTNISMQNLPAGMYVIHMLHSNGATNTGRVIIMK